MLLIRDIDLHVENSDGVVATIGNFDGVHLGHQSILNKVKNHAKDFHLPAAVITFEPSAKEFFNPDQAPARLTNFREKFSLLKNFNLHQLICLHFNAALANMEADEFIEKILVKGLSIKHLIVGDNFRFGKKRLGDYSLLLSAGEKFGFTVENTDSFEVDKERVSSTAVRNALAQGNLSIAEKLLGRSYSMSGRVIHGDKQGRTINFPTANIPIKRLHSPVQGVFAVKIKLDDMELLGVANVGNRPTVDGKEMLIEVHIFEFSKDVYGKNVEVIFCKKLREEKKFDSFEIMRQQIEKDAEQAKEYFSVAA